MDRVESLKALLAHVEAGHEPTAFHSSRIWPNCYTHAINAYNGDWNAAKALHDAVLPGWGYVYSSYDGHFLIGHPTDVKIYEETHDPSQPRAWLIAIIKALIAQEANT